MLSILIFLAISTIILGVLLFFVARDYAFDPFNLEARGLFFVLAIATGTIGVGFFVFLLYAIFAMN